MKYLLNSLLGFALTTMTLAPRLSHADTVPDEFIGWFDGDREVQQAMRQLRAQMNREFPNCEPTVIPQESRYSRQVFSASALRQPNGSYLRRRTYLVAKYFACQNPRDGSIIRRSVNAKVVANLRGSGSNVDETPTKVVVVEITNQED